jgi:hypothetical protein
MSMVDRKAHKRIQALEERAVRRDREVAELSSTVSRLKATVEAILASSPRPSPAVPRSPPTPACSVPSVPAIEELRADIWGLKVWRACISLILADFPALFAEFRGKRFALLWRGSRDGFRARDFHRRCDGYAPTLTLIEDTKGNIFGGFTPVEWESGSKGERSKADPSLKSFLFTLKNPHNFPARKFALRADMSNYAIHCYSSWGPHFTDMAVFDGCNASTSSYGGTLGGCYANDTGLDGNTFFTGSRYFTVKEIEVFEVKG